MGLGCGHHWKRRKALACLPQKGKEHSIFEELKFRIAKSLVPEQEKGLKREAMKI